MVQADKHVTESPHVLLDLLFGMMSMQATRHTIRLRIAELVKDGLKSIFELAEAIKTHAPTLSQFWRALASIDIFTEVAPECFAQTSLSSLLLPDVPGCMYPIALLHSDDWQWPVWEGFASSLQTGQSAFRKLFGIDMWQYFAQKNTAEGQRFQDAMTGLSE